MFLFIILFVSLVNGLTAYESKAISDKCNVICAKKLKNIKTCHNNCRAGLENRFKMHKGKMTPKARHALLSIPSPSALRKEKKKKEKKKTKSMPIFSKRAIFKGRRAVKKNVKM
jgi:hypothetical protein